MKFYQRRFLRAIALVLGLAALLFGFVHTRPFTRFVAGLIEDSQEGRLRIGSLSYRLWRGEVTFEDVVWTEPELTATVPEVTVELSLQGLHRVRVRSPRVRWLGGTDTSSGDASGLDIPALPAARIEVADGSLVVDALEASEIHVTFEPSEGTLQVGRITYPDVEPASLEGRFSLDGNVLRVDSASANAYGATLRFNGALDFDTNHQSFEAELSELDLARFDPRVTTRVSGSFEGALDRFDYRTLEGDGILTVAPDPEAEIRVQVGDERVRFESDRVTTRGVEGSVQGELTFTRVIEASFRGRAQLQELHDAARGTLLAEGTVSGALSALRADASFRSENLRFEGTPLALEGKASFANDELRLASATVVHPSGARAVVSGVVSDRLSLTGSASYESGSEEEGGTTSVSASLSVTGPVGAPVVEASLEAEAGGGHFTGTGRFDSATRAVRLSGEGADMAITQVPDVKARLEDLRFEVEGTLDAPLIQATALLTDVSYLGVALPETLVTGESDGTTLTVEAGDIVTATTTLESPYLTHATISLDPLPLSELASTFPRAAGTQLSVSGKAIIDVPLNEPESLRYRVEATRALGVYRDVVLGAGAPFIIEGDLESFRIQELDLIGEDTAIGLEGTVPLSSSGAVNLDARGALRIDLLHLWFPEAALTGRANATLHIEGTLEEPEWNGDVVIDDVGARFAEVTIDGGHLVIEGQRDPPSPVNLRIQAENVVARTDAGEIELSLTAKAASEDALLANVVGDGRIESLVVRAGGLEMESQAPAAFTLADGLLAVDPVTFEEEQTKLTLRGEARPFGEVFEWTGELQGTLNHALLNSALSELGMTYTGTTEITARATNVGGDLVVEGGGSWRDARLTLRDPQLVFTNVAGDFELDGSTITLTSLTADAGGGKVAASGTVALSGTTLEDVNLTATASSVRLSYPEGLRSEIGGSLALTGSAERLRLSGDIELNRAVFSRDIDVETELLQSIENVQGLSDTDSFAESVQLDIRVSAADGLRIDNNLARMETTANLTVGGTLGTPELRGIVASRPGGRFRFGRNNYLVESGRIELTAYPAEPPVLDIDATTSVGSYDLRLEVRGPTDDLVTNFSAPDEPGLTQGDVASLLLTGRTLETASSESRAILGEQMASFLGSTLGDLAELGLGNALPFQLVTVEPSLIAQEADPAARFTLGAALTNELTMVYSIGLDDAENQIWIVDYELPFRARTQLVRRQDNEFSIGLTQKLQYDPRQHSGSERRGPRVASVSIVYLDDEPPESAPEIQRNLRPKPGSRWDYWNAWEHAERVRQRLREEGYLEATVDVVSESCGERCLDVRYEATLGVPVAFLWRGDPVDDSLHEAVKQAWNGQLGEAFVATDLTALAEGKLFAKGYYLASVTATTQRTDQGVTVTVDFQRGPKGKTVALEFQGNEALPASVLRETLPERTSAEFYELLTTRRPRFKQLLELRYASSGYLTAEVSDPERRYDASTGTLVVSVPIHEGNLFRTDAIEFQGVEAFEPAALRARIPLREGGVFRPSDFVQSRASLASFYRQQGYPDVTVTASLLDREEEGTLGARFVVNEGRRATVGTIAVAGNESTRDGVVLREVAFTEGETLKLAEVNETQKRLYELGAFRSAEVVVGEPGEGDTRRDVTIRVREVPRLAFEYGLRVATDGLFQLDTEVSAPNLFGRAHHASFRTLIATDERTFRLTYHTPYFARYKLDTDFFLERGFLYQGPQPLEEDPTQQTVPFRDHTWRFTAQQTRVLSRQLNVQWSYSFKHALTEFEDPQTGLVFATTQDTAVVTGAVVGDYRDNVVRPTRGALWNATLQLAPTTLGSDTRFTKLFTQLFTFVPLGKGVIWAAGYRVGVANDYGGILSLDDGFRAGGATTVRGFGSRDLGPVDRLSMKPYGGSGLLVLNQEIRFPLFWLLRGVGFYDAGNAFEEPSDIKLTDLRQSVGAGLRLGLNFGVLRFDFARAIDPIGDEPSWRFIFTLGHAF